MTQLSESQSPLKETFLKVSKVPDGILESDWHAGLLEARDPDAFVNFKANRDAKNFSV